MRGPTTGLSAIAAATAREFIRRFSEVHVGTKQEFIDQLFKTPEADCPMDSVVLVYRVYCGPRAMKGAVAGTAVHIGSKRYRVIRVASRNYYAHIIIQAMRRERQRQRHELEHPSGAQP